MKLQTQFTVSNKDLRDLDYVNKVKVNTHFFMLYKRLYF